MPWGKVKARESRDINLFNKTSLGIFKEVYIFNTD